MARHLTVEEREVIAHMLSTGHRQVEIAHRLERVESTISRELRRNRSRNGYGAVAAQRKAQTRRSQRPRRRKMQCPDVRRYVQERLRQDWSPDEIAGRSRQDFPEDRHRQVSHQTIYTWIDAQDAAGKRWRRDLRSSGWKPRNSDDRGRTLPHHAACLAQDAHSGQRQGVRGPPTAGNRSGVEGLLRGPLLGVAARHQRKHRRPDPAILPEGDGSGQGPQASFHQSPTSPEPSPPKTSRLPNAPRSPRTTPNLAIGT
jgi:hypothetical protein